MKNICMVCGRHVRGIESDRLKLGMCAKHYNQFKKYGKCLDSSPINRFDPNGIEMSDGGDYAYVISYDKYGHEKCRSKIDTGDIDIILNYKWNINNKGYMVTKDRDTRISMHRYIVGVEDDMVVDHINGETLDNRRSNLRICTQHENCFNRKFMSNNTSGKIGVRWHNRDERWYSYIKINRKTIHLGCFVNIEDAINARKKAEEKYFGEFAFKGGE